MDGQGEVCLEEEVEKLRRSGMSATEISRRMSVDQGWVEAVISTPADDASPEGREPDGA